MPVAAVGNSIGSPRTSAATARRTPVGIQNGNAVTRPAIAAARMSVRAEGAPEIARPAPTKASAMTASVSVVNVEGVY